MKKLLVVALAVGLVGTSMVGPSVAGKKKKKPKQPPVATPVATPVTLFFSNTSGGCTAEGYVMVLVEPTEGSNCGSAFSGPVNEALVQAGEAPATLTYSATEGLPFVLDATQKITGTIQVMSFTRGEAPQPVATGPTTMVAEIFGETGGETKSLGVAELSYTVTPAQKDYPVEIEIAPPGELDKAEFTSLSISLYNRGAAPLHGWYRAVAPASKITVPTWK